MRSRNPACRLKPILLTAVASTAVFLCLLPSPRLPHAQMKPFDYRGDSLRAPAEIIVDLAAADFKIKSSVYSYGGRNYFGEVVDMEGFQRSASPGDPMLPSRVYEVAVPPNIDWQTLRLTLEDAETADLPGRHPIAPAPPMHTWVEERPEVAWGIGTQIADGRNANVYGRTEFFPSEPLRILSGAQLRKWKFIRLEFRPLAYNPATETLRLVKSASARVSFERIGTRLFRSDPALADTAMDPEARRRFVNFSAAEGWYRYAPEDGASPRAPPPGAGLAIVTTDSLRRGSVRLADYIALKSALGFTVHVATEDDYGRLSGQAPYGRAEKIRQWLIENHLPLGISHVLLIGNPDPDDPADPADSVGDVPMKMLWPNRHLSFNQSSPSDYFYADLTGNWDLDGDGFFGESVSAAGPASPAPGIGSERFSVRWSGRIMADAPGSYRFQLYSDEGVRLAIDGQTVIDHWAAHAPANDYGAAELAAGLHDMRIEFYDREGDAALQLFWAPPGGGFSSVPATHLYHLAGGAYAAGGLTGEYYNRLVDFGAEDLPAPDHTRIDASLFFFWGTGDMGIGGVDSAPDVWVGRIPVYDNDTATLDAILQKLMIYAAGPSVPAWRRRALLPMKPSDPGTPACDLGEAIKRDCLEPQGWEYYRIYDPLPECASPEIAPCREENVLNAWKQGYGLVAWWSHGSPGVAFDVFSAGSCAALDDSKPAFTFQAACNTGYPELAGNLGYALLKQGAAATLSAARNSYYSPGVSPLSPLRGANQDLAYYTVFRLTHDSDAGHALYETLSAVSPDQFWSNILLYNLYGDPSLRLSASSQLSADYTVNRLTLDRSSVAAGDSVQLQAELVNQAGAPAIGDCTRLAVYLLSGAASPPPPILLDTWDLPGCSLAAGQRVTHSHRVVLPASLAPGDYTVQLVIDPANSQTELIETNNALSRPLRVHERFARWFEAYSALGIKPEELALLRAYRERILKHSLRGAIYTAWLYACSQEALDVLASDRTLRATAAGLLAAHCSVLSDMLSGSTPQAAGTEDLAGFLDALAAKSPLRLKLLAITLKRDLLNKRAAGEPFLGIPLR